MQIIHVNLTQESAKPLEVGRTLDMTYSVKWIQTNVTFARRFDVYLDYPFFEHQVNVLVYLTFLFLSVRSQWWNSGFCLPVKSWFFNVPAHLHFDNNCVVFIDT